MGIMNEINAGVSKAVKKGTETYKKSTKIAEQEKIIKKMSAEIGNLVLIELDEGKEYGPAIMERYELIKTARAIIETQNEEKEADKKICPKCGKKNAVEVNYCGFCGADMSVVEEEKEEAPVEDKPME